MDKKEAKKLYDKEYVKKHKERDKERRKISDKAYRELHKERLAKEHRNNQLKRDFGLTLQQYDLMVLEQGNMCACCGTTFTKSAHVDHNHTTGQIRALLCGPCNTALGHYEKKKNLFETYLSKYDTELTATSPQEGG
jgi:hypothetical protein